MIPAAENQSSSRSYPAKQWNRADMTGFADQIHHRTGLEMARRVGPVGGRPPKLGEQQQTEIVRMVSKGTRTAAEAARLFKIHPATVSRMLARVYAK
jgi:hypothetical protein